MTRLLRSTDPVPIKTDVAAGKWPGFVVTTIALATFGPYLVGSIRTEQAVVYGFFLLALPTFIPRLNARGGKRFLVTWISYVVIATIGVVAPTAWAPHDPGSLLAGYDNVLAPLAIMMLIWSIVPVSHAKRLLVLLCKVVAVAMAINGALALASTFVNLADILRPFWANEDTSTTADLAAALGRYSGIFNQPAEAGALYGIGGVAAILAWQNRPLWVALLITLMTVGGLVSVSKVFIFGGLPAIVIYWFWSQRGGKKITALFGLALVAGGITQSGLLSQWTGLDYLGRLFTSNDQSFVELYGAGRFEEQGSFVQAVDGALRFSPLTGVGAAGWAIPYDGAVAEFLVVGGILGLIMLVIIFVSMFSLQHGLKGSGSVRLFAFLLFALTVGGSLGFSPLTANRVSTITWVMIALLVLVVRDWKATAALEDEVEDEQRPGFEPSSGPKPGVHDAPSRTLGSAPQTDAT